ncbi:hypothetical protein WDW86_12050, partial [Bdellovibrionota bacterium FG-2]
AKLLMEHAIREFYPALKPRVDVNLSAPSCWNKDGNANSLENILNGKNFRIESGDGESVHQQIEEES